MEQSTTLIEPSTHIGTLIISLLLIIGLIITIAWVMQRMRNHLTHKNNHGMIHIAAQISLGVKERIALIEAGGTWMLIGVTGENISLLHQYAQKPSSPESQTVTPFRKIMQRMSTTSITPS